MKLRFWFQPTLLLFLVVIGVDFVEGENEDGEPVNDAEDPADECGFYLAESSLRNGGWGVFVAKDYEFGERLGDPNGGLGIPVLHMDGIKDDGNVADFLVNSAKMGGFNEGRRVAQFLPGIYPLINYHSALANVFEGGLTRSPTDRFTNQMAGANTDYHGFQLRARNRIAAGSELFLDASEEWYADAGIPSSEEYQRANKLIEHLIYYDQQHPELTEAQWVDILHRVKTEMLADNDVGLAKLIPKQHRELQSIRQDGLSRSSLLPRKMEWIKKEGKCLDNIRAGESTIPNAGRGAFATRFIPQGSIITPAPLLHVLDRSQVFLASNNGHNSTLQLLVNYCFGHRYSNVLLCPTTNAALINHNRYKVNAEIRWSEASGNRLNSDLDARFESLRELFVGKANNGKHDNNTRLMMDIVATRDIEADEEIFLNYGSEWEAAFERHQNQWRPPTSRGYQSADVLNKEGDIDVKLSTDPSLVYHAYECRAEPMAQEIRHFELEEEYTSNPNIDPANWNKDTSTIYGENDFLCWYPCEIRANNGDGTYKAHLYSKQKAARSKIRLYRNIPAAAIRLTDKPYQSDMHLPTAFRYYIPLPDDMFPLRWRNDYEPSETLHLGAVSKGVEITQQVSDEHEARVRQVKCGVYFAPSNIPNAGFGTYTAVSLPGRGISLGTTMPVIPIYNAFPEKWNGEDYVWNGMTYHVEYESRPYPETVVMAVNDGALANSFIGLVNEYVDPSIFDPVLDRCVDPGAGAFSDYTHYSFKNEFKLGAGEELFVSYGENWFTGRSQFADVPMSQNWIDANRIVASLYRLAKLEGASLSEDQLVDLLNVAKHGMTKEHRTKMALATADSLSRIEHIIERNGTAQATVQARSTEWFEENGQCLDHIYVRLSTIKQAGQGAFARRVMKKGQILISSPLMTTFGDEQFRINITGHDVNEYQLFLNYQFSHPNSSVYFFPINHAFTINHNSDRLVGGVKPNAELRWASWNKKSSYYLERTLEDLKKESYSTMVMDVVATRDIAIDEEIFIDYGIEWEEAWNAHVASWKSPCAEATKSSLAVKWMNSNDLFNPGRFPWTDEVMTLCMGNDDDSWIHIVKDRTPTTYQQETIVEQFYDIDYDHIGWSYIVPRARRLPCRILDANPAEKTFDVVVFTDHTSRIADVPNARVLARRRKLPSVDLVYMHRPFKSDMHLRTAFRKPIKIPDDVFPSQWKDIV